MLLRTLFRLGIPLMMIVLVALGCSREPGPGLQGAQGHLYVTRKTMEADKLASIWLVKRFVDRDASFQFLADELPLTNGIPLDVPEGELRRYANNSCFETVAIKFKIQDAGVQRLGQIMRDIELNYWREKYYPEAVALSREIKALIDKHPNDPEACVEESLVVFDKLLSELSPPAGSQGKGGKPDAKP